jgi:hypothetical protein
VCEQPVFVTSAAAVARAGTRPDSGAGAPGIHKAALQIKK